MTKFVDDLFAAVDAENAADLEAAEHAARATGKEPFSMARLEELLGGEAPDVEAIMRLQYYVRHPQLRTLAEFAARLQEARNWD